MFRYKRWVCVLLVGSMVAVSYGAARKIKEFESFDPELAEADGMAILNYAQGQDKTIVQVILSDFTPNEHYVVLILKGGMYGVDRTLPVPEIMLWGSLIAAVGEDGSLQADGKGHLTLHHTVLGDYSYIADIAVVTLADWNTPESSVNVVVRGLGGSRAQL